MACGEILVARSSVGENGRAVKERSRGLVRIRMLLYVSLVFPFKLTVDRDTGM